MISLLTLRIMTFLNSLLQDIKPGSLKEFLVDDPDEMFQLADLLEGVSVDCPEISSNICSAGIICQMIL